ncbi:MAG: aldo/keto reductase, partial [Pseudomonadota bacterium]
QGRIADTGDDLEEAWERRATQRNWQIVDAVEQIASERGATVPQVALAWLLARDDIIAIPKTGHRDRLRENIGALSHTLTAEQLAMLDSIFPPPKGPRALEML